MPFTAPDDPPLLTQANWNGKKGVRDSMTEDT